MSTFPKIVMAALVVATGTVAALQMAHIRAGLVTSAGADLMCPALLYIVTRRDQTLLRRVLPLHLGPDQAAALNLIACYAWEFCQRYDLRGTPLFFTHGTFDPMDLLAYTVGVAGRLPAGPADPSSGGRGILPASQAHSAYPC